MKAIKTIIALSMIAIMVFALACCGGAGGSGASGGKSPVGYYKLTGMSENGEPVSEEDLAALDVLGLAVALEIREGGGGILTLFGEESEITWDENNITIEGTETPYTFDGKTLSMEEDGMALIFTLEAEEESK